MCTAKKLLDKLYKDLDFFVYYKKAKNKEKIQLQFFLAFFLILISS